MYIKLSQTTDVFNAQNTKHIHIIKSNRCRLISETTCDSHVHIHRILLIFVESYNQPVSHAFEKIKHFLF